MTPPPLKTQAGQVLWFLLSLEGPTLSVAKLARYMDCPKDSVRRACYELRAQGYTITTKDSEVTLCLPTPTDS